MSVLGFPTNDEFDQLKKEVSDQIANLSSRVTITANESAELASESLKRIVELENVAKNSAERLKEILVAADHLDDQVAQLSGEIKEELENLRAINSDVLEKSKSTNEDIARIAKARTEADDSVAVIEEKVSEVNSYIEQSEGFPDAIEQLSNQLKSSEENAEKINSLLAHSAKRKAEIDELYKRIYGEDIKVDDDSVEHTDGIADELKRAYAEISEKLENFGKKIDVNINEVTSGFKTKLDDNNHAFEELIHNSKERIDALNNELRNLLPGAMAAGLSAAYEKKTKDEITAQEGFNNTFRNAIIGLVGVSLIPFAVDIYLLGWQSKDLVQVIKDTPSLIVSILPLYFPVLWLAYSANKKINLSKRLIEEYTHKAVLGKTFSGLSNQIDTLPNEDAIKGELRTRLLFNVLQVSAENPGKLISNYQKSDHPLMEALENSAKLSDSVDVLAKIPGFSALASKLAKRGEDLIKSQAKKIEQGLETNVVLEASPKGE